MNVGDVIKIEKMRLPEWAQDCLEGTILDAIILVDLNSCYVVEIEKKNIIILSKIIVKNSLHEYCTPEVLLKEIFNEVEILED